MIYADFLYLAGSALLFAVCLHLCTQAEQAEREEQRQFNVRSSQPGVKAQFDLAPDREVNTWFRPVNRGEW